MLRLLSLLLLIGGAFAIWIGGQSFLEKSERESRKADSQVAAASQPAPAPAPASDSAPASEPETDATPALIETSDDFVEPEPVMIEPEPVIDEPTPVETEPADKAPMAARSVKPQMSGDPDMAGGQEVITRSMQVVGDAATSGFDTPPPAPVASMPPPPVAVATPAPPEKTAAQAFIDSLTEVPIAHETPSSAEYKQAFNVTFAIDATGDSSAVEALPGNGNVVEGTARVSDRVEVRVIGASFDIEAKSPEIQSLSPVNENTWRWSVTPLTAGSHDLVFEVYAIDQDNVVPLRTFTDKVTVQVSGINQVVAFADQANPLFVLLGGIGSALGGLFGAFSFFKRRR